MKRSEMINCIYNLILSEQELNTREVAETILDYIQELGMLPPWNMHEKVHPDFPLDAYVWEPEDG